MVRVLVVVVLSFAGAAPLSAQTRGRFEIAAIARADLVSFEGGQSARLAVAGAGIGYRVSRNVHIEGEATAAAGESRHSYEGDFISYAEPGAAREEILRMAVIARRTTVNKAGLGFAAAAALETHRAGRVNLTLRSGVSFRRYDHTDETTVLRVPDGVTVEEAEAALPDIRGSRWRSGVLLGASMPLRVGPRMHLEPEVRWVWGGPARVGNNYDEAAIGVRASWTF